MIAGSVTLRGSGTESDPEPGFNRRRHLLDLEEARRPPMAMKDYSDEFKADAVALYESTPWGDLQEHRR